MFQGSNCGGSFMQQNNKSRESRELVARGHKYWRKKDYCRLHIIQLVDSLYAAVTSRGDTVYF